MAPITHIVLLRLTDEVQPEVAQDVYQSFLSLGDECRLIDGSKYILSIKGGKQNSPEGKGKGLQYGFVVEFANEEDRRYYLEDDPEHRKFGAKVSKVRADIVVFDFSNGVF